LSDSRNELELLERLTWVLGDRVEAARMLAAALESAGRTRVPPEPAKLTAFARAHVVERLAALVGPRSAMVFLEDLRDRFGVRGTGDHAIPTRTSQTFAAPSASGVKERPAEVLVVDGDRFARSAIARLLIQAGPRVTGFDAFGEVAPSTGWAAVIVALRSCDRSELVELARLLEEAPAKCVVVLADRAQEVELVTRAVSAQILPTSTPAAAVAAVVLAALGEAGAVAK
jgi:hypothetical protein